MDNLKNYKITNCSSGSHAGGCQVSESDREMMSVLNRKMMDLKGITRPIHDICIYLTPIEVLQEFISECGFTMNEQLVCDAMIKNQPTTLPAKSFLHIYFRDYNVTLREFMRVLLKMEQKHHKIHQLTSALWNAALFGNNKYFRKLYKV